MNRFVHLKIFPLLLMAVCASCGSRLESHPPPVARFQLTDDVGQGDLLYVPVEMNGKIYSFLVDTGTSVTVLDRSLESQLKILPWKVHINGPSSGIVADVCEAPVLKMAGQPLPIPGPICTMDLSLLRDSMEEPIMGVLGMDILQACNVEIDFRNRTVSFARSDISIAADAVGFELHRDVVTGMPAIQTSLLGHDDLTFAIDTGCVGNGMLETKLMDELASKKKLRLGRATQNITISGPHLVRQGILLEPLDFADVTHRHVVFREGAGNVLGLRFLSHYDVTFDFPEHRMYLSQPATHEAKAIK